MTKVRDEAAEFYCDTVNKVTFQYEAFRAGWDEALRSEPKVLVLVAAARECLNTSYRETLRSHRVTEASLLKIREALASFKEQQK